MRIIKEISILHYGDKLIDPNTPLGKFISNLNSLINNEEAFYQYISSKKYWVIPHTSLWSFEEVLNYIDDLLFKYSRNMTKEIISKKIIPLLKFLYMIINSSTSKEIFASFDHLEYIFLRVFDTEVKSYIISIYMLFDFTKGLISYYTDAFHACRFFALLRNALIHMINNNYRLNNDIIAELEEIVVIVHKRWKKVLFDKNNRLSCDEKKFEEINPFQIFKEIIINHKDYKNKNEFLEFKKEYEYFAESDIYERVEQMEKSKIENVTK